MSISPMMQQYQEAKAACPDALLLFRMGDFYELFFEDARLAARLLGLTLTSRDKGDNPIPMAGFPYHQLESYLARLIASGQRVAICEQVEDPKQATGLVKREVTRVVTAGTLTDDALLDPRQRNYLAALAPGEPAGLAWVELSSGQFYAMTLPSTAVAEELARIDPAECLQSDDAAALPLPAVGRMAQVRRPGWAFSEVNARRACGQQFGTLTLEGFGFTADDMPAIRAAGAVLDYLQETQRCGLAHLERLTRWQRGTSLELDEATRRSLEIHRTLREGRREGSLLGVLDRTVTAMGARRFSDWLAHPLVDPSAISERLDAVEELVRDATLSDDIREQLRQTYDLERLLARVTTGRASPRDLRFLGRTLGLLPHLKARLTARRAARLNELEGRLDLCAELRAELDRALEDDCPLSSKEGGFIRAGFDAELDRLRELARGGKQWIAQYQAQEQARSGIATLKVGFNKVFGYYLEVTHAHRDRVPEDYIRRQTVKNAERYVTPALKQYEEQVLTADERAQALEYELFVQLRDRVAQTIPRLAASAAVLAELDVLTSLAHLARERNYCRPVIVAEPVLRILDGRHPVLDVFQSAGSFVPNDTELAPPELSTLLITGPNMAGKSTYIRQVALLTLMAQLGSFVPAREATIGIADRIFARVGASDELARGQSTFMVEMTETARILNTASPRSLVILDEIGRGTSTYDGVSLAWAVVEYLHDRLGCRTLFATHYHELTDLERSLTGIKNLNVAVREWQEEVVFLHKIIDGAADKSYGIQVARLAGVPREVIQRAKELLNRLEQEHLDDEGRPKLARTRRPRVETRQLQLTLFEAAEHPLVERLRQIDVNELTPLAALALVKQWQDDLAAEHGVKPR